MRSDLPDPHQTGLMMESQASGVDDPGVISLQERLVACIIALEHFLAEIRSLSGRDEMLALTLRHLRALLPIQTAGFFLPNQTDLNFSLHTPLDPEQARELGALVDQSIDSGVFGWALNHLRPAGFRTPGGHTTLVLAALRTRQRVLGMFAAILSTPSASGWDAHTVVLATFLACAANAIRSEELTLELQKHNRQLDSLVQQRTQQLLEAKEAAELANRAKSTFLATISHELRTPLNAILGYTQILLGDAALPVRQLDYVQTVHHSAEHLLSLINDLLDLSKAESAKIEINAAAVQLWELIEDVGRIVRPLAEDKRLEFHCAIAPAVPRTLITDSKRLRQILLNLLGNAIKFTDAGSVRLAVTRRQGVIHFMVSDTGCGIAAEDLPRLFQPFQQLGHSTQRPQGTGLGLAISKQILQTMGMDLRVQTELGKGTSFWFELPYKNLDVNSPLTDAAQSLSAGPMETIQPDGTLPSAEIPVLKQLAANGDILALERELERVLAAKDADNPVARKLLQLVAACKIKAIRELLDRL